MPKGSCSRQLRIRLPIGPNPDGSGGPAALWLALPPAARSQAIATILWAIAEKIDLAALVAIHSDLRDLSKRLNVAMQTSGGRAHDHFALAEIIDRLDRLFGRSRKGR